jgi:hypothetical protein
MQYGVMHKAAPCTMPRSSLVTTTPWQVGNVVHRVASPRVEGWAHLASVTNPHLLGLGFKLYPWCSVMTPPPTNVRRISTVVECTYRVPPGICPTATLYAAVSSLTCNPVSHVHHNIHRAVIQNQCSCVVHISTPHLLRNASKT